MANIVLDNLIADLDPLLQEYVTGAGVREKAELYLQDLLVNDNLLSTDVFTTTSTSTSSNKTLSEEIAELDESQRVADKQLASITNKNRDLIVGASQNLKAINGTITTEIKQQVEATLKLLKAGENKFVVPSSQLMASLDTNSMILTNMDSILDLFELPTLCKICILQGNYQEALEISVLARNLIVRFPKLPVIAKIYQQIKKELNLMVKNLIKLLNTNIKQNNLIKIFNILNKLDLINLKDSDIVNPTNSSERTRFLKLIYFNSRYKYIIGELSTLHPLIKFNKVTYLKRYIEVYRGELFHSISMFKNVLNHSLNFEVNEKEDGLLINQFVKNLAFNLIKELKQYIPQISLELEDSDLKSQMDGLILQILYLCKSLDKYGQNFENVIMWELCYNTQDPVISEATWLDNLHKVEELKT